METFNNSNNINIERANQHQKKKQQFHKLKKLLKSALACINNKNHSKKSNEVENRTEIDDNNFNEMLERRNEDRQNLINEQINGQQSYCFVENEHGKFYWSSDINRFVAVDRDLITSEFCATNHQQPQIQCC
ncbi:CLUMA_CG019652, isoform A [Clunio marinus]|uniref:CLUMA_CG019652, isoform A n=1 Tax=Clunio marinus TaxID=568069 RepID=A0A1J1J391_9DIPT|nr:CLUMA_CG019652, isoform A [Clunio marinus]